MRKFICKKCEHETTFSKYCGILNKRVTGWSEASAIAREHALMSEPSNHDYGKFVADEDEKFLASCEDVVRAKRAIDDTSGYCIDVPVLILMVRERSQELETSLEVNDATRKDYQARCADLLKERNAWIATVELERSCVKGTHSYERIATLEAKLGKAVVEIKSLLCLSMASDASAENMINKARATLEEISK